MLAAREIRGVRCGIGVGVISENSWVFSGKISWKLFHSVVGVPSM